jgi:hypothetical protein
MPLISNTSFNGGEISPLLYHRLELEKRSSSLARCENFLPLPYGGVRKRPGTRHIAQITGADANSRMFAFRGSEGERFVCILNAASITYYRIATGLQSTLELPWMSGLDLALVRWQQLNDVVFITHPGCHPFQVNYSGIGTTSITPGAPLVIRLAAQPIAFATAPEQNRNLNDAARVTVVGGASWWVNATYYTAGQHVYVRDADQEREYTCILSHTSATALNRPGTGTAWRTNWAIRRFTPNSTVTLRAYSGINPWGAGVNYLVDQMVFTSTPLSGIFYYRCRVAHTSTSGNGPNNNRELWEEASSPIFSVSSVPDATHRMYRPGSIFTIETPRDPREGRPQITAETSSNGTFSNPILISGTFTFSTFGTWGGIFLVQRSRDNGTTWEDVASYEANLDRNFNEELTEDFSALYRLGFVSNAETGSGTGRRRGYLSPNSVFVRCRYRVESYSVTAAPNPPGVSSSDPNSPTVVCTCLDTGMSERTSRWTETAFNNRYGFPSCISIFQRRLIFAGTRSNPLDIWMSRIEDFGSFRADTKDDDPIHVVLAPSSQNRILWLAGQRRLHIGCQTGEWVVGSQTNDAPITPTNFQATEVTTYGSSETVMPLLIGDATVYLQRHDQRIREMGFIADRETYDSADLTRLAEHLLTPNLRITRMAWQASREPTLWCVVSDGTLRTLTYIRQEQVFAWARHRTQAGSVVNITVSPTQADDDEVYWLVNRGGNFMLELLPPNAQQLNESGVTNGTANSAAFPSVYDSQYTGPPISGALPAEARWGGLGVYTPASDAATASTIRVVAAGNDPIGGVSNYVAGIPVIASLVTLPLEAGMENGASLTRYKTATKLYACLFLGRNLECAEYRPNAEGETVPPFTLMRPSREAITRYAAYQTTTAPAPALTAGWVEANVNLSSQNLCAELRHLMPTPCTITALVWDVQISP